MNELNSKALNQVLAYIRLVGQPVEISKIALDLGMTKQRVITIINRLIEHGLINKSFEGRISNIVINETGIKYLDTNNIKVISKEEVQRKSEENKYSYKMEEIKNETLDMKKDIENIKSKLESELKKINETKIDIEKIAQDTKADLKTFYGKLGEILTLIITAISIIVFNIKVLDTTRIDFSKGYRVAFLNIMAIDLPLLILLTIGTFLFHFIIGKEIKLIRQIIPVIIIIICIIVLIA
ncbi:hypothetical protein [Clostridium tagluense]|uniref:hypothetical protein n=1 Tax=Clostridium tagluense TaxID=360422 RepID=UPI001CF5BE35|nr:hypothetical protein [Clostridium tagluense]MCB2299899.1 hypothetical protein [Clostridium tagluense]